MLFTRTIRGKMSVAFSLVLLMLGALAVGAFSGLRSYRQLVRQLNFSIHEAPRRGDLADAAGALFEPLLGAVPVTDEVAFERQRRFQKKLNNANERVTNFHRKLDQSPSSDEKQQAEMILEQFRGLLQELEVAAENLNDPLLDATAITQMVRQVGELQTLAQKIPKYQDGLNDSVVAARAEYRAHFRFVSGIIAACVLLSIWTGYYVKSRILKPLRLLHQGATRVAAGKYDYRVDVSGNDDMAELGDSFNKMTTRFQETKQDLDRQVRERCKQLVRSERLAGIGFLAAGVAHEINNPLSAIVIAAESLVSRHAEAVAANTNHETTNGISITAEDAEVQKSYLEMMQRESLRCQKITHKLLNFARGTGNERSEYDLQRLVSEVLEMVQPVGRYQDRTIDFLRTEPCLVDVNGSEIKQVVLNLVTNSLESMDAGGTLFIRFDEQTDGVTLVFEDNGCGMTKKVLDNLFEPFFTDRRDGKGTGLGMSICQRIVGEHDGTIEAFSEGKGQGSRLEVHLPRHGTFGQSTAA